MYVCIPPVQCAHRSAPALQPHASSYFATATHCSDPAHSIFVPLLSDFRSTRWRREGEASAVSVQGPSTMTVKAVVGCSPTCHLQTVHDVRMLPDAVNYVLLAEDFWIFLATTCQTRVDVRSCFASPYVWNSLPEHIRQSTSIAVFKRSLKHFYSSRYRTQRIRDNSILLFYGLGYISALIYYLLLQESRLSAKNPFLAHWQGGTTNKNIEMMGYTEPKLQTTRTPSLERGGLWQRPPSRTLSL